MTSKQIREIGWKFKTIAKLLNRAADLMPIYQEEIEDILKDNIPDEEKKA